MVMIYVIFTLFVLYTIACCMDGPDLKPLWKRWLGIRLETIADKLHPIDYCNIDKCWYYHQATHDLPLYIKRYETFVSEVARMNALNSHPVIVLGRYEPKIIEQSFMLREDDLLDARMDEALTRRYTNLACISSGMTVNRIVARTKERCIYSILETVKKLITIKEDRESDYPNIIIKGSLCVGLENNNRYDKRGI